MEEDDMGALSPWHVILLLAIALLVLGPGKLPETGAALGKAIRSFQDAASGREEAAPASTPAGTAPASTAALPPAAPGSVVETGAVAPTPAGSPGALPPQSHIG
ncbi:MAG: twin-arginine translocase TatA/TatE family subunit [Candidatus Limnocylindrales bacterium]